MRSHSMAFALVVTGILLMVVPSHGQSPPPNYNYNKLPETRFTCADKATGGYYADPEAGCQMFHVCLRVSEEEINDFKFLCPNNTVFDQQNFICTNWWEIDCERSTRYYSKNELFKVDEPTTTTVPEYEAPNDPGYWEYVYEYVDPVSPEVNITKIETQPIHRLKVSPKSDRSLLDTTHPVTESSLSKRRRSTTSPRVSSTTTAPTTTQRITTTRRTPRTPETTTTPDITTYRNTQRYPLYSKIRLGKPAFETRAEGLLKTQSTNRRRGNPKARRRSKSFANSDTSNPNAKTRYESAYGRTNGSLNTTLSITEKRDAQKRNQKRRQRPIRTQQPEEKHKEFSNFRFYKTAFGRSYSSDDYILTTSTTTPKSIPARYVRPARTRSGRTASRNTRYSKYAR